MAMNRRYDRNMSALTPAENERLRGFAVCVVGCGGLGGHVIELLGRIGIGRITAVDGDVFEESNLNRQLLSDEGSLGKSKARAAKRRMGAVNSEVEVTAVEEFVTAGNCEAILSGHDLIIDALDSIEARRIIEGAAQKLRIPLVHGAIAGWLGQVSVIMPGSPAFGKLYQADAGKGVEDELGNLPFTASAVASVQAAEAVKTLLGREGALAGKLLTMNLLSGEHEIFEI